MATIKREKPKTVEEYFARLPEQSRAKLAELQKQIRKAAPQAEEVISYSMPAFRMQGILVWYAAFKDHIGFYPTSSVIQAFRSDLTRFQISKGTVQFPMDSRLPLRLITKMVKYRLKEKLT